jgi:ribosomal protein S30
LFSGKVHGSLARAGKVRGQTPKVAKQDKKKKPRGRAHKRMQYNRRFVTAGQFLSLKSFFFLFKLNKLILF